MGLAEKKVAPVGMRKKLARERGDGATREEMYDYDCLAVK